MIKKYRCPAKINLFLEVTGKRPNGYHELATLFAKINLYDELTLNITPSDQTEISLSITGPFGKHLPCNSTNLVWRAAQEFLDFFGLRARVEISLEKNIPTGAGLGGGSSDAAYTLLGLGEAFGQPPYTLLPLATALGADVPLFIYPDTFLKGEGIGEILTPVPMGKNLPYLVLVYPNSPTPTKGVFSRLQLPAREKVLTNLTKLDKLIEYAEKGTPLPQWKGLFFNRLEECVLPFSFPVRSAWQELKNELGDFVLMSGSGSTVVAFLETENSAKQLAQKLQTPVRTCFVATFTEMKNDNNRNSHTS